MLHLVVFLIQAGAENAMPEEFDYCVIVSTELCAPAANNKAAAAAAEEKAADSFSLNVEEDTVADRNERQSHDVAKSGGGNVDEKGRNVESTPRSKWCVAIAVFTIIVSAAVSQCKRRRV